jgi:hypothetical protein
MVFGPYFKWDKVLLEYLGDGFDCDCEDYMIDTRAGEALLAYMRWKSALDMPKKFGQAMIREYKSEYISEKKKAKMRINKINIADFDDMQRFTNKLAPRA